MPSVLIRDSHSLPSCGCLYLSYEGVGVMLRSRMLLTVFVLTALAATMTVVPALGRTADDSVGVVDQTSGLWYLRDPASGATTSFYFGNPGDFPIMGDWNCDGVDTPGLYRQSDGFVYLRNSNTEGVANIRFFFGDPGDIPLAGDFNKDGCDTVSIYRPSQARIFVINELGSNDGGLGAADFDFYFGDVGDKPFTGDFNNNGQDTVGLHRESTGFVYYRDTLTTGNADNDFFFGDPGDQIITGRWAQNPTPGPDTVGIFRPSNGTFYLRFSNSQGNADVSFAYGNSNMAAVAGDFGNLPGGDAPPPGETPPPTTPPPTIPPDEPFTFGAGIWIVGVGVPADTFRNSGFGSGCYWARLSGFSGELDDINANYFGSIRQIVEIAPTDKGFETTSNCGIWSNDLTPIKAPTTPLTPGLWQVGSEAAPGTWRNAPTDTGCYWARLSGFSGELKDIIANDFIGDISQSIVTISASDVGFETDPACGIWTYLGP